MNETRAISIRVIANRLLDSRVTSRTNIALTTRTVIEYPLPHPLEPFEPVKAPDLWAKLFWKDKPPTPAITVTQYSLRRCELTHFVINATDEHFMIGYAPEIDTIFYNGSDHDSSIPS